MSKRVFYLDEAKALAIFFVIAGHMAYPYIVKLYMFSFHVPLFFLVSGYFFRERPMKEQFVRVVKSIMVPYLFFSLLSLSYAWYGPYIHPERYYNISGAEIIKNGIIGIFRGENIVSSFSWMPYSPLWFLVALAVIRIFVSFFFCKIKRNALLLTLCISFVLYFISARMGLSYFSIRQAMICIPFYLIGIYIKRIDLWNRFKDQEKIMTFVCGVAFLFTPLNGIVDVNALCFGNNIFIFYALAINNCLFLISLIKIKSPINMLSWIGRNTLAVLGFSGIIGFCITIIYIIVFGKDIMYSPCYYIPTSILIVVIGSAFGSFIIKRCPVIFGKF